MLSALRGPSITRVHDVSVATSNVVDGAVDSAVVNSSSVECSNASIAVFSVQRPTTARGAMISAPTAQPIVSADCFLRVEGKRDAGAARRRRERMATARRETHVSAAEAACPQQ